MMMGLKVVTRVVSGLLLHVAFFSSFLVGMSLAILYFELVGRKRVAWLLAFVVLKKVVEVRESDIERMLRLGLALVTFFVSVCLKSSTYLD